MDQTLSPSPVLEFSTVVALLRRALGGWAPRGVLTVALMMLVHRRLGVVAGRLERLMTRLLAGKALRRAPAVVVVDAGVKREVAVGWVAPVNYWPRKAGWLRACLHEMMAHQVAPFSTGITRILGEPEWVRLLEASPEARRLLRPMCRMLGVDLALLDPAAVVVVAEVVAPRVRVRKPPVDYGRIPLPRGALAAARRNRRKFGPDG